MMNTHITTVQAEEVNHTRNHPICNLLNHHIVAERMYHMDTTTTNTNATPSQAYIELLNKAEETITQAQSITQRYIIHVKAVAAFKQGHISKDEFCDLTVMLVRPPETEDDSEIEPNEIYDKLLQDSTYAVNSYSIYSVKRMYREASFAYDMKVISYEQFDTLNTILVRNALNNREWKSAAVSS